MDSLIFKANNWAMHTNVTLDWAKKAEAAWYGKILWLDKKPKVEVKEEVVIKKVIKKNTFKSKK